MGVCRSVAVGRSARVSVTSNDVVTVAVREAVADKDGDRDSSGRSAVKRVHKTPERNPPQATEAGSIDAHKPVSTSCCRLHVAPLGPYLHALVLGSICTPSTTPQSMATTAGAPAPPTH